MKNLFFSFFIVFPIWLYSNTIDVLRLTFLANSDKIALVEIVDNTDSTFKIKVLKDIKGTKDNEVYVITKRKFNYYPYVRFENYKIGQKEIIFFQRIIKYELRGHYGESELLYKNDSVFVKPDAFCHGCYNIKYKKNSPQINGFKMSGFAYNDFVEAIKEIDKKYDKYRKLLCREEEVKKERQNDYGKGYNAFNGTVPNIKNKVLIRFKNKSEFHEYILDLLIDEVITTLN